VALKNLDELYFSQSALAIFKKCRRRFRYRYLDGLYWPSEWGMEEEVSEDLERGRLFHLLAERYFSRTLGSTVLEENNLLQAWLNRLKNFCADQGVISAEQEIRFQSEEVKMLAKYDLLKYDKQNKLLKIYDWKTDKKSLFSRDLKESMQSRFYLYLMAEAGDKYFSRDYSIENMPQLIYWNPRYPDEELLISYSEADFKKDRKFFANLIAEIKAEEEFPLTEDLNICRYCEYRPICRGKVQEGREVYEEDLELELNWESVEEMEW